MVKGCMTVTIRKPVSLLFLLTWGWCALDATAQVEEEVSLRQHLQSIPDAIDKQARRHARQDHFHLLKGLGLFAGADENVYRSPDEFESNAAFWGYWGLIRADWRIAGKERLMSTATWQQVTYPDHPLADLEAGELRNWYTRPITDTSSMQASVRVKRRSDESANIRGEDFRRDYAYWRYNAKLSWVWQPDRTHRFDWGSGYAFKNYDEVSGLESLDWHELSVDARYRYRTESAGILRVSYSLGRRDYQEALAGFRDGSEMETNPQESHFYHDATLRYIYPLNERLELGTGYSYEIKNDRFADYESYQSHEFDLRANWSIQDNTHLHGRAGYTFRDYDNISAGDRRTLNYDQIELQLQLQHQLTDSVTLSGSVEFFYRNTNKSTGTIFRDYRGVVYYVGLSYFF